MVVRTAGYDLNIPCKQVLTKRLRIVDYSLLILFKCRRKGFFKADCLGCDNMH